jgi:hypothetical protein
MKIFYENLEKHVFQVDEAKKNCGQKYVFLFVINIAGPNALQK